MHTPNLLEGDQITIDPKKIKIQKMKSNYLRRNQLIQRKSVEYIAACVSFFLLFLNTPSHAQNAPDAGMYVGKSVTIENGKIRGGVSEGSNPYSFLAGGPSRSFDMDIRESFESVMEFMHIGAKAEGSYMGVSGSAEVDYKQRLNSTEDSFYKVVVSSITEGKYTLTSAAQNQVIRARFQDVVPPTGGINQGNEQAWNRFFEKHGTHIIKTVHYGGQLNLIFRSSKRDMANESEFAANAQVAYNGGVGSASGELNYEQQKEYNTSVQKIRLTVDIIGGNKSLIPAKVTNPAHLAHWIASVQEAPAPLKYECIPMWDLIPNQAASRDIEAAYNFLYNRPTRTGGVMSGDTVRLTMGNGPSKKFLCRSDYEYYMESGITGSKREKGSRCYTYPEGDFSPKYDEWIVKLSMNRGDSRRDPIGYGSKIYLKAKDADLWLTGFRLSEVPRKRNGENFLQELGGEERNWSNYTDEAVRIRIEEGLFNRGFTEVHAASGMGNSEEGANAYKYQWEIRQLNPEKGPIYYGDHVKFYVNTENAPANGTPDLRTALIGLSGGRGETELYTFLFDGRKHYPDMYSIEKFWEANGSYGYKWEKFPDPSTDERNLQEYFFKIEKVQQ